MTHKSWLRTDERPLDMDAGHDVGNERIGGMEFSESSDPGRHSIEPVGDHSRQHAATTVLTYGLTGGSHRIDAQVVGIEVDTLVAVELEIEGLHGDVISTRSSAV